MLVMYSILKILPGLKLTFLLIIFGIGGIYLLEQKSHLKWQQLPDPVSVNQSGIMPWKVSADRLRHVSSAQGEIHGMDCPVSGGTAKPFQEVQCLSDLGFHIEL
jgi:hypothetical protein